jgi:septum formation protein
MEWRPIWTYVERLNPAASGRPRARTLPQMRLVLASQSPRRRLLLEQQGIAHEAMHPGVDDALLEPGERTTPAQWAASLAYLKAVAGLDLLVRGGSSGPALVIGADTVVVKGEIMIGQPVDAVDAERIIRLLQDGEHEVVTGVALAGAGQDGEGRGTREIFVERASVRVGRLSEAAIGEYIAGGTWKGKAGAYNLIERIEAGWPIDYDGDAGTIMGLPVAKLVARLRSRGHTV